MKSKTKKPQRKGFACMNEARKLEICRMGGYAVHAQRGSKWMAKIGRVGGKA